jgi:sterol desaturase/sphingolipid hydroxylase (fatty acid hydroxylase superfamily)
MDNWLRYQGDLYTGAWLATFAVVLFWEMRRPVRMSVAGRGRRWALNGTLMAIDMVFVYVVFPIATIALAIEASRAGWGVFNRMSIAPVPALVAGMLVLDFGKYLQHYLLHRVPLLWRIHRTHHADPECDVTTSFRFHPFESVLAVFVDSAMIIGFGVSAPAVALYRIARVILSTVVHGNVSVPRGIEMALRWLVVTPDLHRIHHSAQPHEQNRNLGGGLIWWDRLFGTYVARPGSDPRTMPLGLSEYPAPRANSLAAMLLDPFSRRG